MPAPVPLRLLVLYVLRPRPLDGAPMPASVPAPILRQPRPSDEATLPAPVPLRLLVLYDRRPRPLDGILMPAPVLLRLPLLLPLLLLLYDRPSRPLDGVPMPAPVPAPTPDRDNPLIAAGMPDIPVGDGARMPVTPGGTDMLTDRLSPFAPSIARQPRPSWAARLQTATIL